MEQTTAKTLAQIAEALTSLQSSLSEITGTDETSTNADDTPEQSPIEPEDIEETLPSLQTIISEREEYIYGDHHTPLATVFHTSLEQYYYSNSYYLPYGSNLMGEFFTSKAKCERAKKNLIEDVYHCAEQRLTSSSSTCIAGDAARAYSKKLENVFLPVIDHLEKYCQDTNHVSAFEKLREYITKSEQPLLSLFENELYENREYYSFYDINHFFEKAPIEKHDHRFEDNLFWRLMETIISEDSIEYTVNDISVPLIELQEDLDNRSTTFFGKAQRLFMSYMSDIEQLLDGIGQGLPELLENESVADYIHRICA
jgi:hypothetical protein